MSAPAPTSHRLPLHVIGLLIIGIGVIVALAGLAMSDGSYIAWGVRLGIVGAACAVVFWVWGRVRGRGR